MEGLKVFGFYFEYHRKKLMSFKQETGMIFTFLKELTSKRIRSRRGEGLDMRYAR